MKLPVLLCSAWVLATLSAAPLPFYDAATAPGVGNFNTAWKGFPATFNARQKTFAKTKDADKGAVVFLGDSLTEGAPLAKLFPKLKTANRGISGDTTRGMLYRLKDNVLDLNPKAVVFLCGTNDMHQPGGDAAKTGADMRAVVDGIRKAYPKITVIVLKTPPNDKQGPAFVKQWNATTAKALEGSGCVFVDTCSIFLKPDGSFDASVFRDGTHFKPEGYERYRKALAPALEQL